MILLTRIVFLCVLATGMAGGQAGKAGIPGSAGGVKWTAPAKWSQQPARQMRAATYDVPAAASDKEPGECAVFFFGPGQGGGVQANLDRWVGQFQPAEGMPKTGKLTVGGFNISTIDVSGTYMSGGPMGPKSAKPGFRMLAAVVEGKQAPVFFKFTGPAKTVAAAEADFKGLLNSLKTE